MADTPEQSATPPAPGPPTEEEVLADPRLRPFLEPYSPMFHDLFLKSYARVLQDLHHNGERYESNLEYLLHQHDKAAYEYLWAIQHQKLFDLECQWRAGLVEVPEARLTADFEDWHNYIEECPVLPPISLEELALFDAFLGQLTSSEDLETGSPCNTFWLHRRYPRLREDDEEDEDLTPWTEFWDLHRGSGYLRQLPDLRGEKEHHYEKMVIRTQQAKNPPPPPVPADPRPQVPTYGDEFDEMVRDLLRRFAPAAKLRQFETRQQLEAYDASEDRLHLPLALERLQNAGPISVSIEAHVDWREAIIAAGHRHYLSQLRAALPRVYDDYCQRVALGIALAPASERRYHKRGSNFKRAAKQILKGRRLFDEPEDFDF